MKLDLGNPTGVSDEFDYVATTFDNGITYGVWHGGHAPLNGGGGRFIGDIARYSWSDKAWYATPDQGNAKSQRWYGPFPSHVAAARFLVGSQAERDQPALHVTRDVRRFLRTRVRPPVDESQPESRRSELAFRRAVPPNVNGYEIVWVGPWEPGGPGFYANAVVVTKYGEEFTTHRLIWNDDRTGESAWTLDAGVYDLSTVERARWSAEIRAQ